MITDDELLEALVVQHHGGAVGSSFTDLCLGETDLNENALRMIARTLKSAAKRHDSIGQRAASLLEEANDTLNDLLRAEFDAIPRIEETEQ